MPMKRKCERCGVVLNLHDAFAGAACRCRHCGAIFDVPAAAGRNVSRSSARPTRPALAAAAAGAVASTKHASATHFVAGTVTTGATSTAKTSFAAGLGSLLHAPLSLTIFGVLLSAGVGAWYVVNSTDKLASEPMVASSDHVGGRISTVSMDDSQPPAGRLYGTLAHRAIVALPSATEAARTYFSHPLTSSRVAWVIDGGEQMRDHYDKITWVTKSAVLRLRRGSQSFGVAVASQKDPLVQPMESMSYASYQSARSLIDRFQPTGESDLVGAFSALARQRPDVTFLVTARPLTREEVRTIHRQAVAIGTAVNVVTIGDPDPMADMLASSTAGSYTAIEGPMLVAWQNLISTEFTLAKAEQDVATDGE